MVISGLHEGRDSEDAFEDGFEMCQKVLLIVPADEFNKELRGEEPRLTSRF